MKDERVLAYCNLFGILGAIPKLLELDPAAAELVAKAKISIGFSVKSGPQGTLSFLDGKAWMREGVKDCSIKLFFPSPAAFNALIDGDGKPIPVSGFWHVGFLLGEFTKLTDLLSSYLRPSEEALSDPIFFERSTTLMLHVVANAVAQIGNEDPIGKFSASNIVDGVIRLSVADRASVAIAAKDHHLSVLQQIPDESFSEMCFDSLETARALFDGKINAVVAVGLGQVRIGGMISQIDNVNRILDRVSLYLA